jgi:rubrerythrin
MESQVDRGDYTSLGFIEGLMAHERDAIKAHQNRAESTEDRKLRSLFTRLAEIHAQSLAELQSYLSETRSQNEITSQINEIFL